MGDIADWIIDNMMDDWEDGGRCAPQPKTCMRCGHSGCTWVHTGERWALQEWNGRLHVCDTAASPDEFD